MARLAPDPAFRYSGIPGSDKPEYRKITEWRVICRIYFENSILWLVDNHYGYLLISSFAYKSKSVYQ